MGIREFYNNMVKEAKKNEWQPELLEKEYKKLGYFSKTTIKLACKTPISAYYFLIGIDLDYNKVPLVVLEKLMEDKDLCAWTVMTIRNRHYNYDITDYNRETITKMIRILSDQMEKYPNSYSLL